MKYLNRSIEEYLKDLSSNKPAPGGGSAAAVTACIGVSLLLMVANFTKGKKQYEKVRKSIKAIIRDLSLYKKELEHLIDEDVRVYKKLDKVLKLPKSPRRTRLLRAALKKAAKVPLRICEISDASLEKAKILYKKGNRNLLSDVDCGVFFLRAASKAAMVNVEINLKSLRAIK